MLLLCCCCLSIICVYKSAGDLDCLLFYIVSAFREVCFYGTILIHDMHSKFSDLNYFAIDYFDKF